MKKFLIGVLAFGLVASSLSAATVSSIENNGNINGVPSSVVQCSSGGRHVIYYKNGTWYHGSLGHMGDKYNNWSQGQVAEYVCKEL